MSSPSIRNTIMRIFSAIGLVSVLALLTACGGGGSTPANVPRYAYVANYLDDSVSAYAVDATTGRIKYIGKAAAGTNPYSVTVDPSGRYAYVANYFSDNVSQYTIGTDGRLTAMTTPTVAAGDGPRSVTTTGSWQ